MKRRLRLWRRVSRLRALIPGFALLAFPGVALAQGAESAGSFELVRTDASAHPVVRLTLSAPRELVGRDVPPQAFSLTEDGESRPVQVTRLDSEPLEVLLVIDVSGSMQGEAMAAAKAAATEFVRQMPPGTEVAVVAFGDQAVVASPFSTDPATLATAIDGLVARGETALYDAVVASAEVFSSRATAQRAVVLLSDGGDTVSTAGLDRALGAVGGLGADFFAVALVTAETDIGALEQIAAAAEGRVLGADEPAELAQAYDAIASRLVNQYVLEYESAAAGATRVAVRAEHEGTVATLAATIDLPAAAALAPPPEAPAPGPVDITTRTVGLLQARWTLAVGGLAFAAAFAIAGVLLLRAPQPRRRLALEVSGSGEADGWMRGVAERAAGAAERLLERRERSGVLNAALDRAGLRMRPGEFLVLAGALALLAGVVGFALGGPVLALAFLAGSLPGARWYLNFRAERRRARFADQLGDTLQLLAGSLRSGYGLPQAVDAVAREAESPTRDEFRRLIVETRLGRNFSQAMRAMADRVGNEDFDWVVQAIDIHREVGGDLSEIFDQVGETIRDRNRIRRQVKALSAEGRLSGIILFALPFGVAFMVSLTNPEYLSDLVDKPAGNVMLAFAGGLMVVGGIWMRRIVRPEF